MQRLLVGIMGKGEKEQLMKVCMIPRVTSNFDVACRRVKWGTNDRSTNYITADAKY